MLYPPRDKATERSPMPLEAVPWYAWEAEEADHGWLLTYVDVLSVILAMVVVLLGRMAVEQLPPTAPPATGVASNAANQVAALGPAVPDKTLASPSVEHPANSPEQRFSELVEQRFQGEVTAVRREQGVSVEIADVILFESARAELQTSAVPILTRLAATLQEIGTADIAVEGHTDSRPLQGGEFESNWELAAARANAVTAFLLRRGLAAQRLRAVSYGDTRPVADNARPDGQAANRRVELRVEFVTD